jgi:acetyl CoA:N6-hydroxylysine acetyl transferase
MIFNLKEVSYSPISLDVSFKASMQGNKCIVTSNQDDFLEVQAHIQNEELTLDLIGSSSNPTDQLFLVMLEYLLGHDPSLLKIKANFHNPLGTSFPRSDLFQLPLLWTKKSSSMIKPERWTQTKDVKHPVRPLSQEGHCYQRYIPHLEKVISLRRTHPVNDLEQFHEWHNQSRVSFFWELNKPKDELKEYMENGLKDHHLIPMIVELNGEPVGYFEMYWVREDRLGPYYDSDAFDRGFHFLIGNKKFLGKNYTDSVLKSALHFLFLDDPRTRRIMAEPRHDNQKVLKYAEESIGWKQIKIFDFPHKRAVLLENSREVFFGGNAL